MKRMGRRGRRCLQMQTPTWLVARCLRCACCLLCSFYGLGWLPQGKRDMQGWPAARCMQLSIGAAHRPFPCCACCGTGRRRPEEREGRREEEEARPQHLVRAGLCSRGEHASAASTFVSVLMHRIAQECGAADAVIESDACLPACLPACPCPPVTCCYSPTKLRLTILPLTPPHPTSLHPQPSLHFSACSSSGLHDYDPDYELAEGRAQMWEDEFYEAPPHEAPGGAAEAGKPAPTKCVGARKGMGVWAWRRGICTALRSPFPASDMPLRPPLALSPSAL